MLTIFFITCITLMFVASVVLPIVGIHILRNINNPKVYEKDKKNYTKSVMKKITFLNGAYISALGFFFFMFAIALLSGNATFIYISAIATAVSGFVYVIPYCWLGIACTKKHSRPKLAAGVIAFTILAGICLIYGLYSALPLFSV